MKPVARALPTTVTRTFSSGADGDHQEQTDTEGAGGRRQHEPADAERRADLPDQLLARRRAADAGHAHAVLHYDGQRAREQFHAGAAVGGVVATALCRRE
jgi:hypothetical protein